MTITRLLARPMLATIFVVGGVNALRKTDAHAEKAKKITDRVVPLAQQAAPSVPIPTDAATLVRINAGAQILAAAALATGRAPRLSATVLAASLVPTTLAGHAVLGRDRPAGQGHAAPPVRQEHLHPRRPAPRRRRHRGQARPGLAGPPRRQGRTP